MTDDARSNRLRQFALALARLEEALDRPEDSIVRDACIQRFEFTFETAWRAIQADALMEGVNCASPRDCLRAAFRLEIIDNDERWFRMVEDRNRTSHTYDEALAADIYRSLSGYAAILSAMLARLGERERLRQAEEADEGGEGRDE